MSTPTAEVPSDESRKALLRLGARWVDDAIERDSFAPPLIDALLEQESKAMLYGPSGSGKSSMAIDLACHIALGHRWHGRYVQRGAVVYIAAEAYQSVVRRVSGFKIHHGVRVPLPLITAPPAVLADDKLDELVDRALFEGWLPPVLVIIDTLAAAFPGDEGAEHFTTVAASLDRIREAFHCAVLLVHHSGKQHRLGARGHSSLFAAMDTVIHVGRRGDRVTATVEKQRDGATGDRLSSWHRPVTIGTRPVDPAEANQAVTASVLIPASEPEIGLGYLRPTDPAKVLLNALREGRAGEGPQSWLRSELYRTVHEAMSAVTPGRIGRNTPKRAVEKLVDAGVLEEGADGVFTLRDACTTAHLPHNHSQSDSVTDESQTHSHPTPL